MQTLGDFWGAETSPSGFELEFAQAAEQTAPGILSVAQQIQLATETIVDAVSRARMQLAMTDYQRDKLQIEIDRARSGLPPLVTTSSGAGGFTKEQLIAGAAVAGIVLFVATRR